MKHARQRPKVKEYLAIAFTFLAIVFLAIQTFTTISIEARTVESFVKSSSSSSQSPRKLRLERRAKALLRTRGNSSSSVVSENKVERPGVRALRNAAPVMKPLVRPTVILEKAGCGDGLVIAPEACDDGNKESSDGCSSACIYESGFTCNRYSQPTVCTYVCGDGKMATGHETCDDGNTGNGDGCNQYCKKEPGYTCTTAEPNICTVIPICGNQLMESTEACDDGNTRSGDGCSPTCTLE